MLLILQVAGGRLLLTIVVVLLRVLQAGALLDLRLLWLGRHRIGAEMLLLLDVIVRSGGV